MNWNKFNAGWGKHIVYQNQFYLPDNANIDTLEKKEYALIPFFRRKIPIDF